VLPLGELEEQLAAGTPAGPGRTLVFDERGGFVAASRPLGTPTYEMNRALADAGPGTVRDYIASDSLRVVGSALSFPLLRWTLVGEEDYDVAFAPSAAILGRTVALNLGIVLALSGLAFAVVASMVRPLHALSDCARRLRDGEDDVELPVVHSADEVGILALSFGEMVKSLKRANEVLEQLHHRRPHQIHNHRFFHQLGC
jgi:HAMP domain-containing protein